MSRFTILNPLAMLQEQIKLKEQGVTDAFERSFIDERALVTTPMHKAVNRLLEIEYGDGRHGSCGMGIWQAVFDAEALGDQVIRMGDYRNLHALRGKLRILQEWKREQSRELIERCRGMKGADEEISLLENPSAAVAYISLLQDFVDRLQIVGGEKLDELLDEDGTVIFEPHQGVLIDRRRGFMPYCTPSVCTLENAKELLDEHDYDGDVTRLGITRAYMVRHGPGPLVSEDTELTERLPDTMNGMHRWQRRFRIGWLDTVALGYAINCCGGVDELAVTCLDRLSREDRWWLVCAAHDSPEMDSDYFHALNGVEVSSILLGRWHDLDHQHRLTELLMKCRPKYEVMSACCGFEVHVEELLDRTEHELRQFVTVVGFGPTAADYQTR